MHGFCSLSTSLLLLLYVSHLLLGVIQTPCDFDEVVGIYPDIVFSLFAFAICDMRLLWYMCEWIKNIGNDNTYILIYVGVIVVESCDSVLYSVSIAFKIYVSFKK